MRYDIEKVIRTRILRGWTQAELARRANKSPATICKMENEDFTPLPSTMKRIADELGLEMKDLLMEERSK